MMYVTCVHVSAYVTLTKLHDFVPTSRMPSYIMYVCVNQVVYLGPYASCAYVLTMLRGCIPMSRMCSHMKYIITKHLC